MVLWSEPPTEVEVDGDAQAKETPEEYEARRAAAVAIYGEKKETAKEYAKRRRKLEKQQAARMQRRQSYESLKGQPLPKGAIALSDLQEGTVLAGKVVEEFSGQKGPKAWFDVNVWRRCVHG